MSRPQVTITLGRSGQVVKRPGQVLDNGRSDQVQPSRAKRSIRERLGSNMDNPLLNRSQPRNKRQRRDGNKWSPSDVNEAGIVRDDLRLKLIRKNMSRATRSDGEVRNMNLRKKMSRREYSPMVATHSWECMPDPKVTGLVRRIPPTRSADDLLHINSLKKSYSSWTMGGRKSPYRNLGTSRGLSPTRNMDDLWKVPSVRPVDSSRPPYMSKDNLDTSRSTGPTPYISKASVGLDRGKPVARLPPPSGIMQKSSYAGEEPHTVVSLLHSLGLGKYAIYFQVEEVDMTALRQMGDNDLKELGIPMGPRKKILLAVMPRSKRLPLTSRT